MSWSPFSTLQRLIGPNLFNHVGPEVSHQRTAFIREFSSTKSNFEKFDTIAKIAAAHVNALADESSTAEVANITIAADSFALALWGETLYGNPQNHIGGRILSVADTILHSAGDPWPSIGYSFRLLLKLVSPGEPTRSEAKLRAEVAKIVDGNMRILEEHERKNPNAPLKTIRNLSVMTGGGRTGPLSPLASEFTNLNIFGSLPFLPLNGAQFNRP